MTFTISFFAIVRLFFVLCLTIQASPVSTALSPPSKSPFVALLPRHDDTDNGNDKHILAWIWVVMLVAAGLWMWITMGITVAVLRKTNDKSFFTNFKDGLMFKRELRR
jgi:hypothetical protein